MCLSYFFSIPLINGEGSEDDDFKDSLKGGFSVLNYCAHKAKGRGGRAEPMWGLWGQFFHAQAIHLVPAYSPDSDSGITALSPSC